MYLNHSKKATLFSLLLLFVFSLNSSAQDKLKQMPGYAQYQKMAPKLYSSIEISRSLSVVFLPSISQQVS